MQLDATNQWLFGGYFSGHNFHQKSRPFRDGFIVFLWSTPTPSFPVPFHRPVCLPAPPF